MTRLRGFTLIELTLGLAITSFLTFIIMGASLTGLKNYTAIRNSNNRLTQFMDTFNRIDRNVRQAKSFPTQYPEAGTAQYTTSATTLIMKLHSLRSDGSYCANNFDYVVYTLANGTLNELVFADPVSMRDSTNQNLMSNITSLAFTQSVAVHRQVVVSITQQSGQKGQTTPKTHVQTMVARND